MLYMILQIALVFIAAGLITLILLQQGKGADAGAAFGSGASATVFGAQGSASFLSRATAVLATLFFIVSLSLAYLARHSTSGPQSVVQQAASQQNQGTVPAAGSGQHAAGKPQPTPAPAAANSKTTGNASTDQKNSNGSSAGTSKPAASSDMPPEKKPAPPSGKGGGL